MITTETYKNEIFTLPIKKNQLIICIDTQELFYDTYSKVRISVGSNIAYLNTEAEKDDILVPVSGMLYIVKETGNAYLNDGTEWNAICGKDIVDEMHDSLKKIMFRINELSASSLEMTNIITQTGTIALKNNHTYSMSAYGPVTIELPEVDLNRVGNITLYIRINNYWEGMIVYPSDIMLAGSVTESGYYKFECEWIPIVNTWKCVINKLL